MRIARTIERHGERFLARTFTEEERAVATAAGEGLVFYYRSIPALTRPLLTRGVSASAPLLFTEPDALRKAWLRQRDEDTWGAIQESIRQLSPLRNEASASPAFP